MSVEWLRYVHSEADRGPEATSARLARPRPGAIDFSIKCQPKYFRPLWQWLSIAIVVRCQNEETVNKSGTMLRH